MRRKVLLVQPSMQPPGGGNGVAAWTLQALVSEHDVTVLTWWPIDVAPINRFFGTDLRLDDFSTHLVPPSWKVVPDHLPIPVALLRSSLVMRYTRRLIDDFDVIIGVHNETDYGRRGIQYVHYPAYLRPRPEVDLRWYHRYPPLLDAYYAASDRLAGFSLDRMKSNLTLCNSRWTAAQIRRSLGIESQVLYPPVLDSGAGRPWSERTVGFVAMGRISPEKEYERVLRIVDQVRRHVPDATLTIVGTWDAKVRRYYNELRALAASLDPAGAWIRFRHDLTRDAVRALLTSTRYGIHGMREEHFGMAPAEMARAGMIVWVPRGGGQVEIVGDEPQLTYETTEEAVERIRHVIGSAAEEERLRRHLAEHGARFGHERFITAVREIVEGFRE